MNKKREFLSPLFIIAFVTIGLAQEYPSLNNKKMDGYKGIWFTLGQFSEFGDKYSGGLGTYTAKHIPLAVYAPEAKKTFFVYGGIAENRMTSADSPSHNQRSYGNYLLCMIGCYDHTTNRVCKPTVVYDKKGVFDPHDNPSISLDSEGFIWVFVSGRGRNRPGFIFKSSNPYSIDAFECVVEDELTYPQPKFIEGKGFLHLFTKYTGVRQLYYNTSADGVKWSDHILLAAIKREEDKQSGHYQISGQYDDKVVFFFNWHPDGDVDRRTNIYYMQTTDFGKSWTTVDGIQLPVPVTETDGPALVKEFFSREKNVYIKDVAFDTKGNPLALYLSGRGHQPGPNNGLKEWCVLYWNGFEWENHTITTSDHNYDTGSIWTDHNKWTVVIPSENSPQKWGGGGELVLWESTDKGKNWKKKKQITNDSPRNHNYARKVVNGCEPFIYFWADGNPDKKSQSVLYFGNLNGDVWQLPYHMERDSEVPEKIQ